MQYAFMTFSCPELTLGDALALARRLGYDGIEPRTASGHRHGVETAADAPTRAALRRQVAQSGVALAAIACSCKFADPATVAAQMDDARRHLDLAGDLGAPRLRVFGGTLPEGVTREAATAQVAEALRALADHAEARGVTLCVETHDAWSDPAPLVEVLRRVDHPRVAATWDVMHPVRAGHTMDSAFALLAPWVRHVHVHDGALGGGKIAMMPMGEGDLDHRRALELLRGANYDGFISGEWIHWEPYETHLPRELAALKAYEASL